MRRLAAAVSVLACVGLLGACAPGGASMSAGTSPTPEVSIRPLPADLVPRPEDLLAEVSPGSPPADPSQVYRFMLGHCGILSPIDFDGSLWDPVGASTASGGAIDEQQQGELINATEGQIRLTGEDAAQFRSSSGLVLFLARHEGAKRYPGCM